MKRLLFGAALAVILLATMLVPGWTTQPAQAQNAGTYDIDFYWQAEPCTAATFAIESRIPRTEVDGCEGSLPLESELVLGVGSTDTAFRASISWNVPGLGAACQIELDGLGTWEICFQEAEFGEYASYTFGADETTVELCVQVSPVGSSDAWGSTDRCNPNEFATVPGSDAGWFVADGTRQWLSPACRTQLENLGAVFGVTTWNKIARSPSTTAPRSCDDLGGELGAVCTVVSLPGGIVDLSWPDVGALGYDVSHDSQAPIWVTNNYWTDVTPGLRYTVMAWGNGTAGTTFKCEVETPVFVPTIGFVTIPGNSAGWYLDGFTRQWISPDCRSQLEAAGKFFELTTWQEISKDPATTWPRSCSELKLENTPAFACRAVDFGTTIRVSWDDLGATGYDVVVNDRPARWVTDTSYEISVLAAAETFTITAWGNGTDGTSCTTPVTQLPAF